MFYLLVLSVIQLVICNKCCKNYRCTLIDNETLCSNTANCHWTGGGLCVGNICSDYQSEPSCYGPHDKGVYTEEFYCKWENDSCVAGTGDCSNYDNSASYCLKTGQCKYNGSHCLSASSCSDFSDPLYISDCSRSLIINGAECHLKDGECKDFACSDLVDADACNAEVNCVYDAEVNCTTITSCSLLSDAICDSKEDSAGNTCIFINDKCRKWDCGNFDEKVDCLEGRGAGRCNWPSEKCTKFPEFDCSTFSAGGPASCNYAGCFYIEKCPLDPNAITSPESTSLICVPNLLAVLLFLLLLL